MVKNRKEIMPREKIKKFGLQTLTDSELLAVILKTGIKEKDVFELSDEILSYYFKLKSLEDASYEELMQIKGIGEAKALELVSAIELGKRIASVNQEDFTITKAKDAYEYIKYHLQGKKQEHFICIYLSNANKVICHRTICIGTDNQINIDIKEALRWAIRASATGVIFIHNHPSGDASPSVSDYTSTTLLQKNCEVIGIKYLDHVIVGQNCFYSFRSGTVIKDIKC